MIDDPWYDSNIGKMFWYKSLTTIIGVNIHSSFFEVLRFFERILGYWVYSDSVLNLGTTTWRWTPLGIDLKLSRKFSIFGSYFGTERVFEKLESVESGRVVERIRGKGVNILPFMLQILLIYYVTCVSWDMLFIATKYNKNSYCRIPPST